MQEDSNGDKCEFMPLYSIVGATTQMWRLSDTSATLANAAAAVAATPRKARSILPLNPTHLIEEELQTTLWLPFDDNGAKAELPPGLPLVIKRGVHGLSPTITVRGNHINVLEAFHFEHPVHERPDRVIWDAEMPNEDRVAKRVRIAPRHCQKCHLLLGFVGPLKARRVDGVRYVHIVVAGPSRVQMQDMPSPLPQGTFYHCGRFVTTLVASNDYALLTLHATSGQNWRFNATCTC